MRKPVRHWLLPLALSLLFPLASIGQNPPTAADDKPIVNPLPPKPPAPPHADPVPPAPPQKPKPTVSVKVQDGPLYAGRMIELDGSGIVGDIKEWELTYPIDLGTTPMLKPDSNGKSAAFTGPSPGTYIINVSATSVTAISPVPTVEKAKQRLVLNLTPFNPLPPNLDPDKPPAPTPTPLPPPVPAPVPTLPVVQGPIYVMLAYASGDTITGALRTGPIVDPASDVRKQLATLNAVYYAFDDRARALKPDGTISPNTILVDQNLATRYAAAGGSPTLFLVDATGNPIRDLKGQEIGTGVIHPAPTTADDILKRIKSLRGQ